MRSAVEAGNAAVEEGTRVIAVIGEVAAAAAAAEPAGRDPGLKQEGLAAGEHPCRIDRHSRAAHRCLLLRRGKDEFGRDLPASAAAAAGKPADGVDGEEDMALDDSTMKAKVPVVMDRSADSATSQHQFQQNQQQQQPLYATARPVPAASTKPTIATDLAVPRQAQDPGQRCRPST